VKASLPFAKIWQCSRQNAKNHRAEARTNFMVDVSKSFPVGEWLWSAEHRQPCKVIEVTRLWDNVSYHVWLSSANTVIRTTGPQLKRIDEAGGTTPEKIRFTLYASRIANLLNENILLAPVGAAVIPLPHQIRALRRATSQDRIRFLLADEVGLGKTIEAGLVMRELKLRGLVRRILVIAPKGLVTQWIAEMQTHFREEFRFYSPADFNSYRRISPSENVWRTYDQVICSLDSVKPLDSRKGWSAERVAQFNKDRFEDLISAGWDLIVVDESHRICGSSEQVARYQLGRGLSEASPYLLLLSATPHQGKTDAFHRLMSLLDRAAFPDPGSVTRERVRPYVIRTEKRHAIDADGKPLFKPRVTKLIGVSWEGHSEQKQLYDAVTEYVRQGYNQAMREKKSYVGFLMILMQRLVTSSTRAIAATLEKRLSVLGSPEETMTLLPVADDEEWNDMDGQEQLETLLKTRLAALKNERTEVDVLLNLARKVEASGTDAKAEALLDWIYKFQQEENDPDVKVLVFTEFVPTQQMLAEFLRQRSIEVVCLNGAMSMAERRNVQERFAKNPRVLISTDAGGEGLNLQFCHIVVNLDLPWNPMKLEQRIGRVDRIGQDATVRAINFVFEDTVEFRVREVLEQKLAVILEEFGVDKTSDVLDSVEAAQIFDNLYVEALLHPDHLDASVEQVTETIRSQAGEAHTKNSLLADSSGLTPDEAKAAQNLPLNDWLRRMTENYVVAFGGRIQTELDRLRIIWPGEQDEQTLCFPDKTAAAPVNEWLTLDHPRVRGMLAQLPRFVEGMPIPSLCIRSLPAGICGFWSIWEISIVTLDRRRNRIVPLFVHDDERVLAPTARFLWEQLCVEPWSVDAETSRPDTGDAFRQSFQHAMEQSHDTYRELRDKHLQKIEFEQKKRVFSFKARRKMLVAIGLPEVRDYRLRRLAEEEERWQAEIERQREALPALTPLLIVRIGYPHV
jgi:superfamily II DNA or RNA helicase